MGQIHCWAATVVAKLMSDEQGIFRPVTYAPTDAGYFDYDIIEEGDFAHRGPVSLHDGAPVVALGAAQTFGRFVHRPYTLLLQETHGIACANLGFAGPGPEVFLDMIDLINLHPCVVVQVLSARSVATSFLGGTTGMKTVLVDGLRVSSPHQREMLKRFNDVDLEIGDPIPVGSQMQAKAAWDATLASLPQGRVAGMVEEVRATYVAEMTRLLKAVTGKKILFWFSERAPDYALSYDNVEGLFGGFPQLVDQGVIDRIMPFADGWVECITNRGMPMRMPPPGPGKKLPSPMTKFNTQYPSQDMQDDAAAALGPYLKAFLDKHGIAPQPA